MSPNLRFNSSPNSISSDFTNKIHSGYPFPLPIVGFYVLRTMLYCLKDKKYHRKLVPLVKPKILLFLSSIFCTISNIHLSFFEQMLQTSQKYPSRYFWTHVKIFKNKKVRAKCFCPISRDLLGRSWGGMS